MSNHEDKSVHDGRLNETGDHIAQQPPVVIPPKQVAGNVQVTTGDRVIMWSLLIVVLVAVFLAGSAFGPFADGVGGIKLDAAPTVSKEDAEIMGWYHELCGLLEQRATAIGDEYLSCGPIPYVIFAVKNSEGHCTEGITDGNEVVQAREIVCPE